MFVRSGLSVCDGVEDRPVGLDQSSSLLIASTETTNLLAAMSTDNSLGATAFAGSTRSPEFDLGNLRSLRPSVTELNTFYSWSCYHFEQNKTPNLRRLTWSEGVAPPPLSQLTQVETGPLLLKTQLAHRMIIHPPPHPLIFPNYDSYISEDLTWLGITVCSPVMQLLGG